ncbi:MAG: response regulator [Frankiales bacterium]|jgi:HD-like signal output (HDOD) protein/ActR/RegA family two-component response regulator|nr:response regulator [Frankiales bacterium]
MNKPRVLFVDDEPRILDGLRRSLRGRRQDWDMSFAAGGAEALDELAESTFDVIVSDMRMPGMDGAELLTLVSERHPEVARVVLSGHTEREAAIKVAVAGHRFLTKPSEPDAVIAIIEQLMVLTSQTHPVAVRRIAGAVRSLPSLPAHIDQLSAAFRGPDIELRTAVDAASHDVGLTAKLLQLSNSAFFGARTRIASVDSVVNALGVPTIQALVGLGQVLSSSLAWDAPAERHLSIAWRHAAACASIVGSMASPGNRPYAQAASLLQDIGRFVCVTGSKSCDGTVPEPVDAGCAGIPCRDVGVELLHLWGLPAPIISAVAARDTPQQASPSGLGVSGAVRAAHLLLQQTSSRDPSAGTHEDELEALLTHPQLASGSVDWHAAAAAASERAMQRAPE